jgi:predicted nucleic acid-binding protein
MILLDSSILIELFRKKDKERTLFYRLAKSNKLYAYQQLPIMK